MNCLKCHLKIDPPSSAHYGLHTDCFTKWFGAKNIAKFISLQMRASTSDQSANQTPQDTSFFHGKFRKYSATLEDQSYILKMCQKEAPEIPEVEYLCNQIGRMLGVSVAEFYFILFNGERTFVTKNFIKHSSPTDLQHIYHFRSNHEHSCEGLINVISKLTQRPYDVKMLIRTILFDSLIGNHDRHGRNLALIITASNKSLSPIYDNVSYLSLESGNMLRADFNPTGKISTSETSEPSMRDYVKELKKLGYEDDLQEFFNSIKLSKLNQIIDESFCSALMKEAIKTLIKKRFEELKNELSN